MATDTDHTEKDLDVWLVIDWKNDQIRARKTDPGGTGPYEIAIPTAITVRVPEVDVPTLEAEVEVPRPKVERVETEQRDREADEPPWMEYVEEAKDHPDARGAVVEAVESGQPSSEWRVAVNAIVGVVLRHADGAPDPERVEKAARGCLEAWREEHLAAYEDADGEGVAADGE